MHTITMLLAEAAEQTPPPAEGASFWAGVGLAAAIATALATAASTIVSIWWRVQDRQEAEFIVHVVKRGGRDAWGDSGPSPEVSFHLQNVGDGTAHKVMVTGSELAREPFIADPEVGNYGGLRQRTLPVPLIRTAEKIHVGVKAESFEVWDSAYIEVSWWPPPTRKQKQWLFWSRQKTTRFVLSDITPVPDDITR